MAEKIVSPGVFTNEKDLSFLPQGVAEIGACVIGSTRKGPAFVPTLCDSMADFETKFGAVWEDSYVPFTVQQYLKSAGQVTIVRVLGENGHINSKQIAFKLGQTAAALKASGSNISDNLGVDVGGSTSNGATVGHTFKISDGTNTFTYESDAWLAGATSTDQPDSYYYYFSTGSDGTTSVANLVEEINNSAQTFVTVTSDAGVLSISASAGGTKGNSITFSSGSHTAGETLTLTGGVDSVGGKIVAVTAPAKGEGNNIGGTDQGGNYSAGNYQTSAKGVLFEIDSGKSSITDGTAANKANFTLHSSDAYSVDGAPAVQLHNYTMSFNSNDKDFIGNVFGRSTETNQPAYLWKLFKNQSDLDMVEVPTIEEVSLDFSDKGYSESSTPSILSQDGATLFTVKTLAHGENSNEEIKIAISNVKKPGSVPGSDYGSFTLQVRRYWNGNTPESDLRPLIVEQFNNVSLDPDSANYFPRAIGDRYVTIASTGKLTLNGDWPNKSKYIRVDNYKPAATLVNHIPFGFGAYKVPFDTESSPTTAIPTASFVKTQSADEQYNSRVHFGIDFGHADTREYHSSLGYDGSDAQGGTATGSNANFSLVGCVSNGVTISYESASSAQMQFIVGFQGGYDGFAPMRQTKKYDGIGGGNTQGWNLGTVGSTTLGERTDYGSFKKAINAVSNPDEFDINMLVIPGVDAANHKPVTTYAKNMCEDRGDTFYIMDLSEGKQTMISTVTGTAQGMDTNYAAVYYPWVRIIDSSTGKLTWVPPSVVMAGVIAFTDRVSHEWFAPAGLLRGGLSDVIEAETRLTHDERDELYEGRVNPIASFPGQGVVVWGQKTLQGKPSALDRVNVRRLLIKLKKFIASSTKFLVFEQNTAATRNRFLNIVNPFLEQVQQNSGLSAFKVVMDDTNNTPDIVDRNILFGQIFIQPTRTAEFIILDFNIMPTGATFPE